MNTAPLSQDEFQPAFEQFQKLYVTKFGHPLGAAQKMDGSGITTGRVRRSRANVCNKPKSQVGYFTFPNEGY
jgi:hypothetical protein